MENHSWQWEMHKHNQGDIRRKCNWGLDKAFSIVVVDGGWPGENHGATFWGIWQKVLNDFLRAFLCT